MSGSTAVGGIDPAQLDLLMDDVWRRLRAEEKRRGWKPWRSRHHRRLQVVSDILWSYWLNLHSAELTELLQLPRRRNS